MVTGIIEGDNAAPNTGRSLVEKSAKLASDAPAEHVAEPDVETTDFDVSIPYCLALFFPRLGLQDQRPLPPLVGFAMSRTLPIAQFYSRLSKLWRVWRLGFLQSQSEVQLESRRVSEMNLIRQSFPGSATGIKRNDSKSRSEQGRSQDLVSGGGTHFGGPDPLFFTSDPNRNGLLATRGFRGVGRAPSGGATPLGPIVSKLRLGDLGWFFSPL